MMYASCPEHYDEVGRGNLSAQEEHEILERLPPFDPRTARSAATTARWSSSSAPGRVR